MIFSMIIFGLFVDIIVIVFSVYLIKKKYRYYLALDKSARISTNPLTPAKLSINKKEATESGRNFKENIIIDTNQLTND